MIRRIKERWWGEKRLWLFSGSFKDTRRVTVDINPEVKADYCLNCEELPFEDNSFDFVMADPPYSAEEARKLYDLPYPSMVKVLNEMARVARPSGHIILLHRLVPLIHPNFTEEFKNLEIKAVVGVFTIAGMSNMRALTVWQKPGEVKLGDNGYDEMSRTAEESKRMPAFL